jgi:hypothetical protein
MRNRGWTDGRLVWMKPRGKAKSHMWDGDCRTLPTCVVTSARNSLNTCAERAER